MSLGVQRQIAKADLVIVDSPADNVSEVGNVEEGKVALLKKSKSSFKKLGPPKRQKSVILNEEVDIEVLMEDDSFAQKLRTIEDKHLDDDMPEAFDSRHLRLSFPLILDIYSGYTWDFSVNGRPWKIAEKKDKKLLWQTIPTLLYRGMSCRFTHLKNGKLIADGEVEWVHKTQGGTMEIKIDTMYAPFYLLANTKLELREIPFHIQAEIDDMFEKDRRHTKKGEKRRMVDPYPILRQEYLQDLLLQEGDFVVHSRQEADHHTNEGFRRLWVSYCTIGPYVGPTSPAIPSTSSISSFSVHLIEPSFQHPLWIDWVGHFTTLSKPWQIKDPSLVLRQGENVFAEAEKLRRYNAALRRRVSPHNVQNLLKEHSEHSGEAEFEMVESDDNDLMDDDSAESTEKNEDEDVKKPRHRKLLGTSCVLVILMVAVGILVWTALTTSSDDENQKSTPSPPSVQLPTPPSSVKPTDLGPFFLMSILLQGITKDVFNVEKVRSAYIQAIQLMPPLTSANTVVITGIESTRRALPSLSVRTNVYVATTTLAKEISENLSTPQKVAQQWPELNHVLGAKILNASGVNVSVVGVKGVSFAAGSFATSAVYVPETTPIMSILTCPPYAPPNNLTIVAPATEVQVGMTATITCVTQARLVGNGSSIVVCQHNRSYSLGMRCELCPPGTGVVGADCIPCAPGSARSSEQSVCTTCPLNTYAEQFGQSTCTACPANMVTPGVIGAKTVSACVCTKGYFRENQGCKACAMGKYSSRLGATSCIDCMAFSNTSATASEAMGACMCNPGYYLYGPLGGGLCQQCQNGTFKNESGNFECTKCANNTETIGLGSKNISDCRCSGGYQSDSDNKCVPCVPGKFRQSARDIDLCGECGWGTKSSYGQKSCDLCEHGTYSLNGSKVCSMCASGTYSLSPALSCTECTQGKFQDTIKQSSCIDCGAGWESSRSRASKKCIICGPGLFNEKPGGRCEQCPAGKKSRAFRGSTACDDCLPGTYIDEPQKPRCNDCVAGTYSGTGNSTCVLCAQGKFSGALASACIKCAVGKFASKTGSSACTNCPIGKYLQFTGETFCNLCPINSNTTRDGAENYLNCSCSSGKKMTSDRACVKYWKVGVQHSVPEADLLAGGWEKCYEKSYAEATLRKDLNCGDNYASRFAFAVKKEGSSMLDIMAMGSVSLSNPNYPVFPLPLTGARPPATPRYDDGGNLRSEPFIADGLQSIAQPENGAYWYISAHTFGFSSSPGVFLSDFDMSSEQCEDRMGWAINGQPGHRVGCKCAGCSEDQDVSKSTWKKVIYKLP